MSPALPPVGECPGTDWESLEAIVERFEAACGEGVDPWPEIDDFLPAGGPSRAALLAELAHADLELRLKAGREADARSYLRRYPELAGDPSAARGLIRAEAELRRRGFGGRADGAASMPVPSRLGKFALIEEVGRGAAGVVYRALDTELGRDVALKLPRSDRPASPEEQDRLIREARGAARLRHPGIVSVLEAGRIDGRLYLAAEFVEGTTLAARLAEGALPPREAAALAADVAEALDHAHRLGVVHRDVKPSNILLDAGGRPLLTDFGLARCDGGEATLTHDGDLLGTPAYMPPEQARGEAHRVNGRGDVYSLGVVLYEMVIGERPFRGDGRLLLMRVLSDDPSPPRRCDRRIPRDLETICLKALE